MHLPPMMRVPTSRAVDARKSNGDFSPEIETEMLNLEIDSLTHTLSRA